jgi:hypothetical protein
MSVPNGTIGIGLKTDAVAESQMRQAIRDLVYSVDPNARLEVEAENVSAPLTVLNVVTLSNGNDRFCWTWRPNSLNQSRTFLLVWRDIVLPTL